MSGDPFAEAVTATASPPATNAKPSRTEAGPPSATLPDPAWPAASLPRRLACFVYEGVLLFGVVMVAGLVFGIATDQRHALAGTFGLQVVVFIVVGAYFVHFWSHSGQTLAMQTWGLRVVTRNGMPLTRARAALRYLLSWLWFVPALLTLRAVGVGGGWPVAATIVAGVLGYAALTWLIADRQYWHDVACGTRLVRWQRQRAK